MQIACFSRKECTGVLHLVIAFLCFKNILILLDTISFVEDITLFYHLIVLAALTFICLFFGISAFIFQSRNSLSHTFLRAHNICTITPLICILQKTRSNFTTKYHELLILDLYRPDLIESIRHDIDASYGYIEGILVIGGIIVCLQSYFVYARLAIAFFSKRNVFVLYFMKGFSFHNFVLA